MNEIERAIKYFNGYGSPYDNLVIKALEEKSAREEAGGWISVEDRLPKNDVKCLCCYHFGNSNMNFIQTLDYYSTDEKPHFQHTLTDLEMKVTHWQPLPKLPKE